jgi:hypothetical protein
MVLGGGRDGTDGGGGVRQSLSIGWRWSGGGGDEMELNGDHIQLHRHTKETNPIAMFLIRIIFFSFTSECLQFA